MSIKYSVIGVLCKFEESDDGAIDEKRGDAASISSPEIIGFRWDG